MPVRLRKILYFLFLFGFLASAPTVVLYTAGYRVNVKTGKISQAGLFSIGTVPKGATVFVDNVKMSERTPAILEDVLPGEHTVRLEKDGYAPWEKTLSVSPSTTTFATEIALFLTTPSEFLFEASPVAVFVEPMKSRVAYALEEAGTREVWIYDPADQSKTLVSRLPASETLTSPWGSGVDERLSITTSAENQTVIARTHGSTSDIIAYLPLGDYAFETAPSGLLLLHDTERARLVLLDDTGAGEPILLNADATRWSWHPETNRLLYSNGFDLHIYDADTHTDETITRVSEPITGLAFHPVAAAVVYAKDHAVFGIELDGRDHRNVTTLATGSGLQSVWTDAKGRYAYFFGMMDGKNGLWKKPLQK